MGSSGRSLSSGRFSRDRIAIDVKDLYEGAPVDIIEHVHSHAVELGETPWYLDAREPNVASRAQAIVNGLLELGDSCAAVMSRILDVGVAPHEVVGLTGIRCLITAGGITPRLSPITYHIPRDITQGDFLDRCASLDQLVVEGLSESLLRRSLLALGYDVAS